MNIIAVIQARVGATRLPGKVLKKIEGKTVLEHVINRVQAARKIDNIVVATTVKKEDLKIVQLCAKLGISIFCGSEDDVLDRYYQAARLFKAEHIIRITSDCPLIDPQVIEEVIELYLKEKADYATNTMPETFPDGLDTEIFSFKTLKIAWENAKLSSEREHVTPFVRKNPNIFKLVSLRSNINLNNKRWTIDEPKDFEFIKIIYKNLYPKDSLFGMKKILNFLKKHPEIEEINNNIIRNEGYLKSLEADKKFKNENIIINGENIYLRELKEEDASQEYCIWLNDPIVNKYLETRRTSIKELKKYIKEKKENKICLFLGIFIKDTNKHIGNIKLEPINWNDKKATLGILIGDKKYWGKGICTVVMKLIIKYTFKQLGLEKIDLGVLSENRAAIVCYLKSGFKIDNFFPKAVKHENIFYDKITMSISKE